ncbi:DUF4270 family protein [Hymenobacter sp. BT770]|uniref:DUF4270 family protein n=1 Tax=Hymenobacter sp. BT770 TaxID=2886942 RepID=UPI001D0FC8F6|nr:DUF4270 family protein [Hymenobacter sp. BT770]MCC3153372.1 DUF4270 domain-containing protein [Hymenobacter sp. BT770]MDO3415546.1 DUF4270 family protein [Hymenobacter sp. BT770]
MNWLTSRSAPIVALAALALASCDKGTDLNVDLPDTTSISTEYTEYKDPLLDVTTVRIAPVQTLKTDHYLVGRLTDNVAGTTEARAYLNVVTGSANDSLPAKLTTPVLDSVVLVMGFDNVNGSSTTPARFDVSSLQAPLDERLAYNSESVTPIGAALGQNLVSRLDRTVQVVTDTTTKPATTKTVADQTLRLVMLRTAATAAPFAPAPAVASPFFTDFFAKLRSAGTSFTQTQLDGLLKGLAIEPSAGYSSGIVSFGRSYNARLAFFFHDDAVAAPAPPKRRHWNSYSIFLGPVFSSAGGAGASDPRYYTSLKNNQTGTPLSALSDATQAVTSVTLNGTSYVQEGIGLGTRVTFKGLDKLLSTPGLTINRAELRAPIKPFSNSLYPNPQYIYALEVDASNKVLQRIVNFLPSDRVVQADGTNQLGISNPAIGNLVDASTTQPYYNLLITSYLQAYLANKLEGQPTSLVLVPNIRTSTALSLNRAVLDAANISLRVYYSKR